MCPSLCLMARICHSTSLTTFHSIWTKDLTTLHALLATFTTVRDFSRTIKNPSTKSSRKPSTTEDRSTFSHFLHIFQFKLQTLGEKIGSETSFGTTAIGRTFLKLYLTRNSPRSIFYIILLTETQSRSVTVACQTSNKTSTATTNPFSTITSCRQGLATVEWKLSALWLEIVAKNRLFAKRPSRQMIITLPKPTWDSRKILLKLDIQITNPRFLI